MSVFLIPSSIGVRLLSAGTGVDVVAYINPADGASRRVLQKSGFAQDARAETGHGERWILVGQRVAPANA